MRIDFVSAIVVGAFVFASVIVIGALADKAIKHQNQICQEGC